MKQVALFLILIVFLPAFVQTGAAWKYTRPNLGMKPVPVSSKSTIGGTHTVREARTEPKQKGKRKILYYRHPMGKPDRSPVPKKDEMGMDYIPVYEDEVPTDAGAVTIAPEIIQNMGVRTIPAEMTVFGRTVRAFGAVTENTRLQTVASSRVEGWIEDLAVTAVGDSVQKGDLLFRLYSPDLIAAQQDYLSALRHANSARISASARRLESLGVQKQSIEALRQSRKAQERMAIYAEHDGVVAELNVREGAYVKPGNKIVVIQDYSSVWVNAAVAEKDLALLAKGVSARLHFLSLPGRDVAGHVDYVYPTIDPKSRTGQVRLVLDNPDGALRPGAYAHVVFDVDKQKRLAIPSEAILRDSEGAYVVKALGGGRFQPQRISIGIVSGGRTEIVSGLKMGQEIVVSGQFLIDSESALRESFRKLQSAQTPLSSIKLTATDLSLIDQFVDAALYIHDSLTGGQDITPGVLDAALQAGKKLKPGFNGTALGPVLESATSALLRAQKARTEQETLSALSDLVSALRPWLMKGQPAHYSKKGLHLAADAGTGRLWLQHGENLLNPYDGGAREIPWPEQTPAAAEMREGMSMQEKGGTGHEHQ